MAWFLALVVVDAVVVLVLGSACQWIYGASVMLITSSAVQTAELLAAAAGRLYC